MTENLRMGWMMAPLSGTEALVEKKHSIYDDLVKTAKRPCTYWRATATRRKICVLDRGEQ